MRAELRELDASDAPAVVALQRLEVTGPLSELGPAFAEAFYRTGLRRGLIRGWCLERDGALIGFLAGSLEAERLFVRILLRSPIRLPLHFVAQLRHGPAPLRLGLEFVRGGAPSFHGPEITFLAVAPAAQRAGIGRRLVERWEAFLAERGVSRYGLSVDAANDNAIGFYRRLGFSVGERFREHGRDRLRLQKTL